MDRAQEFVIVWALLDDAGVFLDAAIRVKLCIQIGAGEYRETITDLLQHFTAADAAMSPALSASLRPWLKGFVGSDYETPLRNLVGRIRVSASASSPGAATRGQPSYRRYPTAANPKAATSLRADSDVCSHPKRW